MVLVAPTLESSPNRSTDRSLSLQAVLCGVGAVLSAYGFWTLIAWLIHGPTPVRGFSTFGSSSWIAARVFECIIAASSVAVVVYVVRGVRRERRLTFDAMFLIAGFCTVWIDPSVNFVQPLFMYSSNWVNLHSWCADMPGVINPHCGLLPEPVMVFFVYTFGLPGFAIAMCAPIQRIGRRWPTITRGQLLLAIVGVSFVVEIALEAATCSLWLWGYPGSPSWMSIIGSTHRVPVLEVLGGTVILAGLVAVRFFKDDRGRSFAESRREGNRRGTLVASILALCGFVQILLLFDSICVNVGGMYATKYPTMPASFVSGVCNAPGVSDSPYGSCPGTLGFRIPIR
jgi:hypothetical protein